MFEGWVGTGTTWQTLPGCSRTLFNRLTRHTANCALFDPSQCRAETATEEARTRKWNTETGTLHTGAWTRRSLTDESVRNQTRHIAVQKPVNENRSETMQLRTTLAHAWRKKTTSKQSVLQVVSLLDPQRGSMRCYWARFRFDISHNRMQWNERFFSCWETKLIQCCLHLDPVLNKGMMQTCGVLSRSKLERFSTSKLHQVHITSHQVLFKLKFRFRLCSDCVQVGRRLLENLCSPLLHLFCT